MHRTQESDLELCLGDSSQSENFSKIKPLRLFHFLPWVQNIIGSGPKYFGIEFTIEKNEMVQEFLDWPKIVFWPIERRYINISLSI